MEVADVAHWVVSEARDTGGRPAQAENPPPIRLLIIDDEIAQDNPVVGLLAFEGVEATCALTGASGLELAWSGGFDAILLDLRLPDVLGMTVLSTLRHLRIPVPVVVATGHYLHTDHASWRYSSTRPRSCASRCGISASWPRSSAGPSRSTRRQRRLRRRRQG